MTGTPTSHQVNPADIRVGQVVTFTCSHPDCDFSFRHVWVVEDGTQRDSHCFCHGARTATMFIVRVEDAPDESV